MLEALEEHHVVKWLLSELEALDPAAERFDAKATVLIENVRHHVKEEETELFPKVRQRIERRRLVELGAELRDAKRRAPTHPHPRSPDDAAGATCSSAARSRSWTRPATSASAPSTASETRFRSL